MVRGGPIDVLTGDYLAELTLAILHRQRMKHPTAGWVRTFLGQMERVLSECVAKNVKVVANAGGLNPRALGEELRKLVDKLALPRPVRIAVVDGDDLAPRLTELQGLGETFAHMDKGTSLADARMPVVTANAYLGAWGIKEALARGADIVVTGRVTDAALVVGPAAWRFEWARDDWDRLAGAVAAGHILECGPQATGGNYAFFEEVPSWKGGLGFPIAEIHRDGSFVVTKHPGTAGLVSVGTVTAQLLYEIQGARYINPDVTARFDSLHLSQEGPDRVRVDGARGEPPPPTTKCALNLLGGFRNSMTVLLTGLDIEDKAKLVEEMLWDSLGGKAQFSKVSSRLVRSDREDPTSNEAAIATLHVSVSAMSPDAVGKKFSSKVIELALASVPGFTVSAPPDDGSPFVSFWPALVSSRHIRQRVQLDGEPDFTIDQLLSSTAITESENSQEQILHTPAPAGPTVRIALGRLFGARSGDKGGNANLGVWARTDAAHQHLAGWLTVAKLKELLPDVAPFVVERAELPNLRAVHFYIRGILGDGVASSTRIDPQAKTLAEYLRAKLIDAPSSIL